MDTIAIVLLAIIAILLLFIVLAKRDGYLESGMRGLKQRHHHKKTVGRIHVQQINKVDADIAFSSLGLIKRTHVSAILEIAEESQGDSTRFIHGRLEFRFVENFDDAAYANAEDIGTLNISNENFSGHLLCSRGFHELLTSLQDTNCGLSMEFSTLFYRLFLFNNAARTNQASDLKITELDSVKIVDAIELKPLFKSAATASNSKTDRAGMADLKTSRADTSKR